MTAFETRTLEGYWVHSRDQAKEDILKGFMIGTVH